MKQVHIIGGTGRIGQLLVEILEKEKIDLSLYVRSKEKARSLGFGNITLTEGNVLDTDALSEAIKGKDYVVAILSGDLLSYAKSIAIALKNSPQTHIVWVTGQTNAGICRGSWQHSECWKSIHIDSCSAFDRWQQ